MFVATSQKVREHICMPRKGSYLHRVHQVLSTTQWGENSSKITFPPLRKKDFHPVKNKQATKTKANKKAQTTTTQNSCSPHRTCTLSLEQHTQKNLLSSLYDMQCKNVQIRLSCTKGVNKTFLHIENHLVVSNIWVTTLPKYMEKISPSSKKTNKNVIFKWLLSCETKHT